MSESELKACLVGAEGYDKFDLCMTEYGKNVNVEGAYDICMDEAEKTGKEVVSLEEPDACRVHAVRGVSSMKGEKGITTHEYDSFIKGNDLEDLPSSSSISENIGWRNAKHYAGVEKWTKKSVKKVLNKVADKAPEYVARGRLKTKYGAGWDDLSDERKKELIDEKARDIRMFFTSTQYNAYYADNKDEEDLPSYTTVKKVLDADTWNEVAAEIGLGPIVVTKEIRKRIEEEGRPITKEELAHELGTEDYPYLRKKIVKKTLLKKAYIPKSNLYRGESVLFYEDRKNLADYVADNIEGGAGPDISQGKKRRLTSFFKSIARKGYISEDAYRTINMEYAPSRRPSVIHKGGVGEKI